MGTTLPAVRAPLPVLTDEVLSLVAGLHPDEALARIAPLWAAARPGLARRALLAARVALMRRAMVVAPLAVPVVVPVVVPVPENVAEPEPAPVFVPAALPKGLAKGALTLLALEDAAKLLMAGDDGAEAEEPADPARAVAAAALAEAAVVEAAAARPKGRKAKPVLPAAGPIDLSAQFAGLDD